MTGPDHEAFYEAMGNEIHELDPKEHMDIGGITKRKACHHKALRSTWAFCHNTSQMAPFGN